MFQTTWAFEMKLKLRHAQVAANDFLYFDALAKYSPLNIISILIRVFENRFQDFQETHCFFGGYTCDAIFSWHKCITHTFPNGTHRVATRLKEKLSCGSLVNFYKTYFNRERYSMFHNHTLFVNCFLAVCMFVTKPSQGWSTGRVMSSKISDEHLDNSLRVAATSIEQDTDALVLWKQGNKVPPASCFCCSVSYILINT